VRLTVRAPATLANLGPGFDCLALAVDLANEFTLDTGSEPGVEVEGEGADELPRDARNLVFHSIAHLAREVGGSLPAFALRCTNLIPTQRGLGSSASAVVGGLLLGDRLLGAELSPDRLLGVAADLEGHADNVAACLRGGLALAYQSSDGWRAERLEPSPELAPAILVPLEERVATEDARRALPGQVPLTDASFNVGRAALAVLALTLRPDLLGAALEDRLHQPHRLPLMPGTRALFEDLRHSGFPVCVAGSGPSIVAFEQGARRVSELGPGWRVLRPAVDGAGATVVESRD
jgi:homoserine kinase